MRSWSSPAMKLTYPPSSGWGATASHLLRDELDQAEELLERARELARGERWTAFLAYPEALTAEVWVRRGDLDRAAEVFEHAFALGCQVDDACWEAYGVRGFGLLRAARGDINGTVEVMEDALTRCARQRDTHLFRRDLGDASAIDAARVLSAGIENPHLEDLIDPNGPPLLDDLLGKVPG